MRWFNRLFLVIFLMSSGLVFAQKSKKSPTQETPKTTPVSVPVAPVKQEEKSPFASWRSELSDAYLLNLQRQVNPFDVRPAMEDTIPKGDSGFRIQLLSTKNRTTADSLFTRFQQWADTSGLDYKLYGYFEFRSPDYRIHVGDFYRQSDANAMATRLQNFFNAAWVVHDKIIQDRSPYYQRMAKAGSAKTVEIKEN